jgi:hypothetical protein
MQESGSLEANIYTNNKKPNIFMETFGLLSCSQNSATGHYSGSDQSFPDII